MWRRRLDGQVTYAQIEQTHNQVEGLYVIAYVIAYSVRWCVVRLVCRPPPPPPPASGGRSGSSHEGDTSSHESSGK
jgi:hypothetical protein